MTSVLFLGVSGISSVRAQDDKPILSLDPGGHTAPVSQVLFTPDGKEMISVGEDKVIRFWDLTKKDAQDAAMPQHDIRGQALDGPDGKLYAAALSPDGSVLAVGGFLRRIARDPDGNPLKKDGMSVYDYYVRLIDPQTGQLKKLLFGPRDINKGIHASFLTVAFSPKGDKLGAGSADGKVVVWDLATDKCQIDESHKADVYGVAFSPEGNRIVSASSDKTVRVWDLAADHSREMKGHDQGVRCVAWSPDGSTIASGGFDNTIRLWDPASGRLRQTVPEPKFVTCLAFSQDSRLLASGLGDNKLGQCAVQLWSVKAGQVGEKPIQQFLKHTATVQAVAFAPGNGLTLASAGGMANDIYLWDGATGADKEHIVSTGGAVEDIGWSPDGHQLSWRAIGGDASARRAFNLTDDTIIKDPATTGWQGAVTQQGTRSLAIAPDNTGQVVLRDGTKEIGRFPESDMLRAGDAVHCYTFTKDGRIAVGSSYGLRLYDSKNKTSYRFVGHTADVLGVSVSPDGRYLASASGDQTVKIWTLPAPGASSADDTNTHDISALLNLFMGANGEWVAWSQSGFYDCSANGENIIGWQINQGDEQAAAYYPASRVGKSLNRKTIIHHLLDDGSEAKAILLADKEDGVQTNLSRTVASLAKIAPPEVKIVNLKEGDTITDSQVSIKINITDPNNSAVRDVQVTDNGQPVTLDNLVPQVGEQTVTIPLMPGENTISVLATNEADAQSNPAAVKVVCKVNDGGSAQPSLTVLTIGVSKYESSVVNSLGFPAKDAKDIATVFKAQEGKLFSHVDTTTLTDDDATREDIIKQLTLLRKKRTEMHSNDYTIVFVAGHGTKSDAGDYYFAPSDIDLGNVEASGVDWSLFTRNLSALPGNVILMLDTCHSAGVNGKVDKKDAYGQYLQSLYNKRFNNGSPLIMLASCDQNELSMESKAWNNGAFTHELVEGLNGAADADHDGVVTIKEIFEYVHTAVLKLTDNKQTPRFVKPQWTADTLPVTKIKVTVAAHTASSGAPSPAKTTP